MCGMIIITATTTIFFSIVFPENHAESWTEAFEKKFGAPQYKSVNPKQPLDQQTVIVEIGERIFEIPKVYIQTNLDGKKKQDALNLIFVLPDFTSRADFKNREEYKNAQNEQRMAHMLIEKLGIKAPLERAIDLTRKSVNKVEKKESIYGLESELWYRKNKNGIVPYYEVYIEKDSKGNVESYIFCSTFESGSHVKYPGCSIHFFNKKLYFDVYFNKKKYLPSWRNQKQGAITFIDHFEKLPSQKNQEN